MSRDVCYICGNENRDVLERHHIVPRRFGGSDEDENLVRLCANCHRSVERLYNKRFYDVLDVSAGNDETQRQSRPCHRQQCTAEAVTRITGQIWGCEEHKFCGAEECTRLATNTVDDGTGATEGVCAEHAQCQLSGCGNAADSVFVPKSAWYGILCRTHAQRMGVFP